MAKKANYTKKDFYITLVLTGIFVVFFLVSHYWLSVTTDRELGESIVLWEFVNVLSGVGRISFFILSMMGIHMCIERFLCVKLNLEINTVRGKGKLFFGLGVAACICCGLGVGIIRSFISIPIIYMCIEGFLRMKQYSEYDMANRKRKWLLGLSMAVSIGFGFGLVASIIFSIDDYINYKSLSVWFGSVEGGGFYAAVWGGVIVCWLFEFIWSIWQMWKIDVHGTTYDGEKRDWTVLVISIILLLVLMFSTYIGGGYVHGFLEEKLKIRYYEQNGEDALPYEIFIS